MSTVALRGILAYDETAKEWSWAGRWVFGDSVPVVASAEASKEEASKKSHKKKQPNPSQPFLYKWQEASEPSKIPVPSLNVKIIGAEEEEEPKAVVVEDPSSSAQSTGNKECNSDDKPKDGTSVSTAVPIHEIKSEDKPPVDAKPDAAPEKDTTDTNVPAKTSTETAVKNEESKPIPSVLASTEPVDSKESSKNDPTIDAMEIDSTADEKAKTDSTNKEVKAPAADSNSEAKVTTDNKVSTAIETPATLPAGSEEKTPVTEAEKAMLPEKQQPNDNKDKAAGTKEAIEKKKENDDAKKANDDEKKDESKSTEMNKNAKEAVEPTVTPMEIDQPPKKVEAPPKITFDSIIPKFLNAAEMYNQADKPAKCPSSGLWKGHFENLIPGKKTGRNKTPQPPQIQKIQETFHLFLNATPSSKEEPEVQGEPNANLFAFETTTKNHIPKITASPKASDKEPTASAATTDASEGSSPPEEKDSTETKPMISLVQVRGCGDNEFGTFEIMGYLDLNTMVMEIQRQYVVTEIYAASPSTRRRRSSATDEGPRPHSTRKRNPTWKRASYDPEEDRRKKRGRTMSGQKNGSPMSIDGNVVVGPDGIPKSSIPFTTNPESLDSASGILLGKFDSSATHVSATSGGRGSKSRLVLPTQSKSALKRSSSSGGVRAKRRTSSTGKSATSSASTKSGSTYIRLPSVGDPKKARWRAAHFLYYQRDDPEQRALQQQMENNETPSDAATPSPTKAAAPKPKYVIYEGEMVDSKREGRGICLFSDGTLYEGQWKRNKEHGYGKLMSSDRKQIIYEGEWERGRMQGTGTYYYGSSDPLKLGSRYVGQFRENLRNGMGRYFLADGSVYDGQWRDGVMNGLGVFTWPDGSIFDGVWKDGKRNGQGLLRKADGFLYDGQWVNNTMEGRGSAIYPNGQKYEGSFSNGRREGRGTIVFTNGAVYEGRFRDDAVDGQGTMKMSRTMVVPREDNAKKESKLKEDFMIPISFQSDMTRILTKTGFM